MNFCQRPCACDHFQAGITLTEWPFMPMPAGLVAARVMMVGGRGAS